MKRNKRVPFLTTAAFFILAFIGIAVIYAGILNAEFVLDDIPGIRENPDLGRADLIFANPVLFFRPLLLYAIYSLTGLDPFLYHLDNIIFHFGTVVFAYLFMRAVFGQRFAFMAALLYAVHPVLIESATWISADSYPRFAFFFMGALYMYVKSMKKKAWYFGSLVFFALSMFSSEKAIVFPAIVMLLELSFFSLRKNWKYSLPFWLIAAAIGASFVMNIGSRSSSFQSVYQTDRTYYNPLVHIPYSITSYILLILAPVKLTIYHAELAISWVELGVRWVFFLVYLGIVAVSFKKSKTVFFWLAFFFITLSPTLIPLNIVWMVAERYAYLPTLGIIAAVVYPLSVLAKTKKYTSLVYVIIGTMIVLLTIRSIERNQDWQSEESLFVATSETSPESPNAHNNMGYVYGRWGDEKNAVQEYAMAIRLKPNYADAYHNMGLSYMRLQNYEAAVKSFSGAVKYNPNLWQSHANLAVIYDASGKPDKAKEHARAALRFGPPDPRIEAIANK